MGNRTFRGDDPNKGTPKEGKPFGGGWDGPQFVLTHHAADTLVPVVTCLWISEGPRMTGMWLRVVR